MGILKEVFITAQLLCPQIMQIYSAISNLCFPVRLLLLAIPEKNKKITSKTEQVLYLVIIK